MEHISQSLARFQQSIPMISGEENQETPITEESPQVVKNSPEWVAEKLRSFNISSLQHTFESFIPNGKEQEKAKKVLLAISNGKLKKQFVLLWGMTGCGKTHLIEATIINWAGHNVFCRYYTFSEIARSLKTALRQGGDFYDAQFNIYRDVKRLVVDDVGMGTTESRFEISDLEDIIDLRYRKRYYPDCALVTIMATNKDIKELPDRVLSRFYDPEFGVVLYMGDKDYRRRKV